MLDSAPKEEIAPLNKLRRDLYKEVSAIANVLRALPPRPKQQLTSNPNDSPLIVKGGTAASGPPPPPLTQLAEDEASRSRVSEIRELDTRFRAVSEATVLDNIMAERHHEIVHINVSIHSLNVLAKELARQVDFQQENTDRIERNIEHTREVVEHAREQVEHAAQVQDTTPCVLM